MANQLPSLKERESMNPKQGAGKVWLKAKFGHDFLRKQKQVTKSCLLISPFKRRPYCHLVRGREFLVDLRLKKSISRNRFER